MEGHPIRGLLFMIGFITLSALVSAAETAINNVNESSVRRKSEEGDKKAERLIRLLDTPGRYIHVYEILFTLASLLIGMTYSFSLYVRIDDWIQDIFTERNYVYVKVGMVIVTALITYLVVLFGIVLPRKFALKYAETGVYFFSGVIVFFGRLLFPFLWLLEKNTNIVLRLFHINPSDIEENVTQDEIISIVNEGQEQGILEAEEAEMISNIIEFDEKTADDIMTHRKKIIAINCEMSIEEALHFMLKESYSRFPVYEKNIDNIVGILHLKDVMLYYTDPKLRRQPLINVAREPYFIPDTQSIDVLFRDMQSKKIHMAIAIDEYGQTAGLVAMEDILEEIVGDILDEYDDDEEIITKMGDETYLIHGDAALEDLNDSMDIEINEEDLDNYDTINGLMISLLDHIPSTGEKACVTYGGYQFEIEEVADNMIRLVKAMKCKEEPQKVDESSDSSDEHDNMFNKNDTIEK